MALVQGQERLVLGGRREYKVKLRTGREILDVCKMNSSKFIGSLIGTTTIAEISPAHTLCFHVLISHFSAFPFRALSLVNCT